MMIKTNRFRLANKLDLRCLLFLLILIAGQCNSQGNRRRNRNEKCPRVRAMRNFDLTAMMGYWYVIQYFASSETLPEYSCMQSSFTTSDGFVTMNFTYFFSDDPLRNFQQGNITWVIPNYATPAHWIHAEWTYEEVYNTYIIDTDYRSWGLIMHCAEKTKTQKYLSALMLSREPTLTQNVINFLREKLPRYDIDLNYMFTIPQTDCTARNQDPAKYFKYESL
ncbi:apolipoprotein D [Malaya genurostris]|uniref:apolipoprotein D n=1 Tax=Malaya genurostris TaxID=325434 RepID=UPI0026F3D927|nr:apolipoprotein D [Malaya genurostris]XP_058443275.1 apolipoprotein D [Malaya genurostris]